MTPSDLETLRGCFRYFHWTRLLGIAEPGSEWSGSEQRLRLGSEAHRLLESGSEPSLEILREKGITDLQPVFQSREWRALTKVDVERELPFIMHLRAGDRNCYVRGRMDAVVSDDPPRVIDYKYATWNERAETDYEIQMTAYCLALMKSSGAKRAAGELWYLKPPMKVIRREYTRDEAERRLAGLLEGYLHALSSGLWPMAERSYCDSVKCGFRERCWAT
jgi:CRISPR/Cas system-associated exonuclease Cas4 (RecB family)